MRKPEEYNELLKQKVKEGFESEYSELQGKKKSVSLSNISFQDLSDPDDYERHKQILAKRGSEGINVFADIELKDNSGKVIDSKKQTRVAFLPTLTNRNTHIINGKEYSIHYQQRLKPGIYTKLDRNNIPTADFNFSRGSNMSLYYAPTKERFYVEIGNSNIPLYTILKDVFNTPDSKLEKILGKDIHASEMKKYFQSRANELDKLYKVIFPNKALPANVELKARDLREKISLSSMDAQINKMTVGQHYSHLSDDALLTAANEVMQIYQGKKNPTNKDNLAFKSVHGGEDFFHESLVKNSRELKMRLKPKIDNAKKISDLLLPQNFNRITHGFFTKSDGIVNFPMQVNIMEFIENAHKITPLGPGGLSSTEAAPDSTRDLDPSQFGYIDLVRTPDSIRVGLDNRIAIGAIKEGNELKTFAVNKKGKLEKISPMQVYNKTVAMSGERVVGVNENNLKLFRAFKNGEMVEVPKKDIDYFLESNYAFTPTTAGIPFLDSTHGQRGAMGAKFQTQAVSLKDREVPFVSTIAAKFIEDAYIPKSKVAGTVSKIEQGKVYVKDNSGKEFVHNFPHQFPLNYHSLLDSELFVKVGDRVTQNQALADHNFSKSGKMALGKNLDIAFIPYKGWNYEDGIVISESGAKKLTSNHIFQEELELDGEGVVSDINKFKAHFPGEYDIKQVSKLDGSVIRKGEKVLPGDPLIVAMRAKKESPEASMNGKLISRIANPFNNVSIKWDRDYPGEVIDVIKTPGYIKVIVKAQAPLVVGDKIANQYGNKGVITKILADEEAPRRKDGSVPDVFFNTAGIKSRKNNGQIYAALMGKLVQKNKIKGPVYYENFSGKDAFNNIDKLLNKHNVSSTDDLIDPQTNRVIKNVFTGNQYILKLAKQTEVNFSARAGGSYDIDLRPIRGGEEGTKNIGGLDLYGVLAHGNTRHLLREMSTYKAEYNPEFWEKLLSGQPLPPPKPTFTFEKLKSMMMAMGVNIKKEGTYLKLAPFKDQDILNLSSGALKNSSTVMNKRDKVTGLPYTAEKGGLFDPVLTGGLQGKKWSHIELAKPVVNELYFKPARTLLNMTQKDFLEIAEGSKVVQVDGNELTGGEAIKGLLKKIDISKEIPRLQKEIAESKSVAKRDDAIKKLKYLKALEANSTTPAEAYLLNHLPVLPPIMRPIYPKQSGETVVSDANKLYQQVIDLNEAIKSPVMQLMSPSDKDYKSMYKEFHTSIKKLQGLDGTTDQFNKKDREPAGFLKTIIGTNPKYGYFQSKILSKAQDIVARATIVTDPTIGLDEVALPEAMAFKIYSPFIIGQMVKHGHPLDKAVEELDKRSDLSRNILLTEMNERPVILNRAPTLHKFGMMAFKPKLTDGKSIKLTPLVVKGFNADFDGDSLYSSVFQRFKEVNIESFLWYKVYRDDILLTEKENNMPILNKIISRNGIVNLKNFPRIEKSIEIKENIEVYDVPDGVEVLVSTNDLKYEWRKPEKFSIHKDLKMVNVITNKHRTLLVSMDHSLRTLDDDLNLVPVKPEVGLLIPVRVNPIYRHSIDKIGLNIQDIKMRKHTFKEYIELTYDVGHLIGSIVGDGWASLTNKKNAICFASITPDLEKKWKHTIETYITNEDIHLCVVDNAHEFDGFSCESKKITWNSAGDFAHIMQEWVGHKAQNKHLPPFFLESPLPFRQGLIAGLIDTDGSVTNNFTGSRRDKPQPNIQITTISSTLAFEIQALAQSLGLVAGITPSKTPKGEECFTIFFNSESCIKLKKSLVLYHPLKSKNLKEIREDIPSNQKKYAPPLPEYRLKELLKIVGSPRLTKKGLSEPISDDPEVIKKRKRHKTLYSVINATIRKLYGRLGHLTMNNAFEIIDLIKPKLIEDPFWVKWIGLVNNEDTEWDLITEIENTPHITEAYDLTIPPHFTMVSASGIVVHDTMSVHMPVTEEGKKEAFGMLPSNNLYNVLDRSPMHTPGQESILGLYKITNTLGKTIKPVKKFRTVQEAEQAYKKGEITLSDPIEILST